MTGLQKQYSDIFYDEKDCSIAADGVNQGATVDVMNCSMQPFFLVEIKVSQRVHSLALLEMILMIEDASYIIPQML